MSDKRAHVISPISLGGERVAPGTLVTLSAKEYVHLLRHGAIEPEEVFVAKQAAKDAAARARAEADRIAAEVFDAEMKKATAPTPHVRPGKFDADKAEAERADAARRARGATPADDKKAEKGKADDKKAEKPDEKKGDAKS